MTKNAKEFQYWSKKAELFEAANICIVGEKTRDAAQCWLKDQLNNKDNVLEIGCGTGIFSTVIAEKAQHLVATDMSTEMLSLAKTRLQEYSNVEVKPVDGHNIAFTESAFDVVFMGNVVHIVSEPGKILRECHRILKQGGRLLLIDYTMAGMPLIAKLKMIKRYVSKLGIPPRENKSYRTEELAAIVKKAGFDIKDAQTITRETNVICLNAIKP